ncbi:MAG: hypothetical protein ACFFCS_06440, partial [Candidatus Hodarchaeota archaeon]
MKDEESINAYRDMQPAVLSNPWFGVGGLERVYLAITRVKTDATIVSIKNYHDRKSFSYYFGIHRDMPRIHDLNLMIDADSPDIYKYMNDAIEGYFKENNFEHSFHLTNHWGLFQEKVPRCDEIIVYFQPGVWEMENINKEPGLREKYKEKMGQFKIIANSKYMKVLIKDFFDVSSTVLYPCT